MLCTNALIGLYNCGLLDLWHKWIEEIGEWTWRYKRTSHVISNRTERQNNIAFTTTAAYPKFCSLKISRFLFNKYYIYSSLHPSAIVGYQLAGQTRPQSTSVGKQESQSYCSWTCITHTQDTGTIGTHTKKRKAGRCSPTSCPLRNHKLVNFEQTLLTAPMKENRKK